MLIDPSYHTRRQIRVNKVLVHENFTDSVVNDIALLKLGIIFWGDPPDTKSLDERVDLSVFSPACLPDNSASFVDQEGHVYGEAAFNYFTLSASQAGETLESTELPQTSCKRLHFLSSKAATVWRE